VAFPENPPPILSPSGQIQNVQNYSSNPFWTPDAPYNQRMPSPVYAQGPDLTAADCQAVTAMAVAQQCGMKNNCAGMRANDIRPAVMVQLSQMTGHNYVSACSGFVDAAFDNFMAGQGTPAGYTGFPTAKVPGSNAQQPDFQIDNPYAPELPHWYKDTWKKDILDRANELNQLQSQNGGGNDKLAHADMPTTIADLSFKDRMQNAAAGYEQWKCNPKTGENCAYQNLNIESEEKYYQRQLDIANLKQQICLAQIQNAGLSYIEADLKTLQDCKQKNKTLVECAPMLKGIYDF